jgi:hypothetical protein
MKKLPVVRPSSCPMGLRPVPAVIAFTALLCAHACAPNNGSLFDQVAAPEDPPPATSAPLEPAPEPVVPASSVLTAPMDSESTGTDTHLPVAAQDPPATTTTTPPAPPPPPAPPATPPGPTILSVSPTDGATGVTGDVKIVVVFSEPMAQTATEAAYQSEGLPSTQVTFAWSADGTQLTITPKAALAYPTGSDPATVPARRINFFISASATDLDGRGLAGPEEFSFDLLRQISTTLPAVQDRNLTGSWRSDDTYGIGQCARDQITICVGDSGSNDQTKGFISFDLGSLPAGIVGLSVATLNLSVSARPGNPFNGLGALSLEHASFATIGPQAFDATALANIGNIATRGNAGAVIAADVRTAVAADLSASSALSQFRLHFETRSDDDDASDQIVSTWDTQSVALTYLVP